MKQKIIATIKKYLGRIIIAIIASAAIIIYLLIIK